MEKIIDKHQEKLIGAMEKEVTKLFEQILNYTEVAVPQRDQYSRLRSKILRLGNDCKRELRKEVENNYEVVFKPHTEDVVEFMSASGKQ